MQEPHFVELKDAISNDLAGFDIRDETLSDIQQKLRERLDQAVEDGKLLSLTSDEVALLQDYRTWKMQSPDAAKGVFHWKKRIN